MNISKLFLIGAVGLAGVLLTSTAQADDHRHHGGDRGDHHRDHRDHYRSYGYGRSTYYYQQPAVVYGRVDDGYYNGPSTGVSIAFGGHRFHHYRH